MRLHHDLEVIGEIGVNHNGDVVSALKLLDAIRDAGAQTAKIQLFKPERIASSKAVLAAYQKKNGVVAKSQFEMLEALTLSEKNVIRINSHAADLGLNLLVTPFDLTSLRFIRESLGHDRVKIGSGDLTFHALIFEASRAFKDVVISTGMANMEEIGVASAVASAGFGVRDGSLASDFTPHIQNLKAIQDQGSEASLGELGLTLMHCTSTYPAPTDELNISAFGELALLNTFLGYSDHSANSLGAVMSLPYGVRMFEKHVTLDKNQSGPDHAASLDPKGFGDYVRDLKESMRALGSGVKAAQPSEINVKRVARRSLFAAASISQGEAFTANNLIALRPEGSVSANKYYEILGKHAPRDFEQGDPIEY